MKLPVCMSCGNIQYPAREICHECLSEEIVWQEIDPQGTLLVSVPLHHSYEDQTGVTIGTVQLKEGAVLITHTENLKPGTPVTVTPHTDRAGRSVFTAKAIGEKQ